MPKRKWVPLRSGETGTKFTVPFYVTRNDLEEIIAASQWHNRTGEDLPHLTYTQAIELTKDRLYSYGATGVELLSDPLWSEAVQKKIEKWAQETVKRLFSAEA